MVKIHLQLDMPCFGCYPREACPFLRRSGSGGERREEKDWEEWMEEQLRLGCNIQENNK